MLAEDHPDQLASQHELARAYKANGQVKEAVALLHTMSIRSPEEQLESFQKATPNRILLEMT